MRKDREPQFTPSEEERIGFVTSSLLDEGEEAIDRLRQRRLIQKLLEINVFKSTKLLEDSRAAGGRTVELANEAIRRAQKELEKRGEDRVSKMKLLKKELGNRQ